MNNAYQELRGEIDFLRALLKEAVDYLDQGRGTNIGSESILHIRFRAAVDRNPVYISKDGDGMHFGPDTVDELCDFPELAKFYAVTTKNGLIESQDIHVLRLQTKLSDKPAFLIQPIQPNRK